MSPHSGERFGPRRVSRHGSRMAALISVVVAVSGCMSAPTATGPISPPGATSAPGPSQPSTISTPGPDALPLPAGPTRRALIQAAMDAGRIDQVTGLIYRAYSALGMPGLPAEFEAGIPGPDDQVLTQMVSLMPELSEADQQRLQPFVVRPTDQQSVFAAAPVALTGTVMVAEDPHPTARCARWADSGTLDERFKVWACADADAAAAEIDIATVVEILAEIWGPMTADVPNGMGPPKPDAYGPNVPLQYGGDARIDFYLLNLGEVVQRDRELGIPGRALAAAAVAPPFTEPDGRARNSSSGFVLVNRTRLGNEIEMKQDLIHEFFHVLEYAHDFRATHKGLDGHWFIEASAVWAETYYDRSNSHIPHGWLGYFQAKHLGLEDPDPDHEYSAYLWPFYMQAEKRSNAIFETWKAIGSVATGDFNGVTNAIDERLPFVDNFHEFAVRNLNFQTILTQAGVETHDESDGNFWENAPPRHIVDAPIVPGEPAQKASAAPPLAADYYNFTMAENAREVTISVTNVQPANQMEASALVHVAGGSWERRELTGGQLKFCRDDPGDDIDQVFLVVSNDGRQTPLSGTVEGSAKETCNREWHLGGRLEWTMQSDLVIAAPDTVPFERHITINGFANVVILVRPATNRYDLTVERGSGSTYSYDYTHTETNDDGCDTHEEGTLETFAGVPDADFGDWSIGRLNPIGSLGEDITLSIAIVDWCGPQWGRNIPDELRNVTIRGFPTCPETGNLDAEFDGTANYIVTCEYSWDRSVEFTTETGSVRVTGTLSPLDFQHPDIP